MARFISFYLVVPSVSRYFKADFEIFPVCYFPTMLGGRFHMYILYTFSPSGSRYFVANFEIFPTLLGRRVHIFFPSGTHLDAPAHFSKGKWRVGIFIKSKFASLILLNPFFGA